MVKGSHHVSLFTISRHDLHDYLRCPKILSIKTYRMMKEPIEEPESILPSPRVDLTPQLIGKVGELATEISFTPNIPVQSREKVIQDQMETLGLLVDERVRALIKESFEGLDQVKPVLEEEYGEINIIGRGETRYGLAPTYGLPDYVAFASGKDKPILVEVKNTEHHNSQDEFQAQYYNTLQRTVGVVLTETRIERDRTEFKPKTILEKNAETIIIYPRLGDHVPVEDTIDITPELVHSIWEAKQLGLVGKSPPRRCPENCPHRRYGIELDEATIEVAKPLALLFAKGLIEKGIDLDWEYLHSFAVEKAFPIVEASWRLEGKGPEQDRKKLADLLADKLNLSPQEAFHILFPANKVRKPDPSDVAKEMASDVEPWERLVGQKEARDLMVKAYSLATRIYTLPDSSKKVIDNSLDKW